MEFADHLMQVITRASSPSFGAVCLQVQTCSTSGAASGAGGSLPAGLGVLQQTRPIDRLRYQAKLVFDHFDTDNDGRSTAGVLLSTWVELGLQPELGLTLVAALLRKDSEGRIEAVLLSTSLCHRQ
jgi:hypothetical protein